MKCPERIAAEYNPRAANVTGSVATRATKMSVAVHMSICWDL